MAISLSKGQKIDLTKTNPGLSLVHVGLGWDTNQFDGGQDFDLDASAFVLGKNGKVRMEKDLIFYHNLDSVDENPGANAAHGGHGFVHHTGDNRTGAGDGDDEVIHIDFSRIPADVDKIAITATIYDADKRHQNFGQVSNAYVRAVKLSSPTDTAGQELMRYDLAEDFSTETAIVVCEFYRHDGEWKFAAIGSGYTGGLEALLKSYGLEGVASED